MGLTVSLLFNHIQSLFNNIFRIKNGVRESTFKHICIFRFLFSFQILFYQLFGLHLFRRNCSNWLLRRRWRRIRVVSLSVLRLFWYNFSWWLFWWFNWRSLLHSDLFSGWSYFCQCQWSNGLIWFDKHHFMDFH